MSSLIRSRIHSLWGCYQLGEPRVAKGRLDLEVQPGGDVSQVTVDERYPREVSRCLSRRVRAWKFPAFRGEPRRLSCSLVFVAAQ